MHLFHRLHSAAVALAAILALSLLPSFSGADDKSALELFGSQRKDMALGSPGFSSPRFSPDGKLLAFDICDKSRCENAIYDIANDRYFAYRDKKGRRITNVSFSPSGKKLAFVVEDQKGFLWWAEPQDRIAVGSAQDNRYTFVTPPEGAKAYPEYLGEETVLFLGADTANTERRKIICCLFITEANGKAVRRLLKEDFYGPSRPRPLWDNKHIVLSDYGFSKRRIPITERYDAKYQDVKYQNEVLRISITDEAVTPMLIAVTAPFLPTPANSVKRLYVANKLDRESAAAKYHVHDVFAVKEGKAERVSQLAVYIYSMDVNPDGKLLALVVPTPDRAFMNGRLLLYDTRTHNYRELKPKEISELLVHFEK